MDEERLNELEKLANEATPGPWKWEALDGTMLALYSGDPENSILDCERCETCVKRDRLCGWPDKANADFIAEARTAVPELITALRKARERADYWEMQWKSATDRTKEYAELYNARLEHTEQAEAEVTKLRELLASCEFAQSPYTESYLVCPVCLGYKPKHKPGCLLQATLAKNPLDATEK